MNDREKFSLYLRRIGFTGVCKPDLETLFRLQLCHLMTVPYENLDIIRNIPISLNHGDLFDKIILRRRGGYCFELNAMFAWLLRTAGYRVRDYMARFLRDEEEIPMRRHRVLRVACGSEDYLCDVGVGGQIPLKPIPICCGTLNEQNGVTYKLERIPFLGFVLYEWKKDKWLEFYSFTEEEQIEKDYIAPSFYCERHPDSPFRKQTMAHIFTEAGRKSMAGRELRIFTAKGVTVYEAVTEDAFLEMLEMHFGIVL